MPINQLSSPVLAAPVELFFSEYVEGSGNNKALEIYNGTGSDVDLSSYIIELYSNGSPDVSQSMRLYGTLENHSVIVIAHGKADNAILKSATITSNSVINFNGDDAIVLKNNEQIIDVIGQIGVDPGSKWGSDASTQDTTLRRKPTIENGDSDGFNEFDPAEEWDNYDLNDFSNLGSHLLTTPTPIPTVTPTEPVTFTSTVTATATPTATNSPTATTTSTPITPPTSTITATLTPMVTISATIVVTTPTETATPVPSPTFTPTATATPVPASPGAVVINEIVTDPQQDWSSDNFSGVAGEGSITDLDEFIELYIEEDGLDLSGWTIELTDSQTAIGDLTSGGAFKVSNYISNNGGLFTFTAAGDYLVLGDVKKAGDAMNNNIFIVLRDKTGAVIDKVELGNDSEVDGPNDGAPDGSNRGGNADGVDDEAVFRYPNGRDTDDDVADFISGPVSIGRSNGVEDDPISTPAPTPPALPILIGEFLYDGQTSSSEGDEFVELCNPNTTTVDLTGYKVGDEESAGGGESMYRLPDGTLLGASNCLVIAKNAQDFQDRFDFPPDFAVGDLDKYTAWGRGSWSLSNSGDELVVLGPADQILDSVAYRNGDYTILGLEAGATAPEPYSLQRVWPTDTNSMPHDFVRAAPNPGVLTVPPSPPNSPPEPALLTGGMKAYWGDLHAHTTYSDGAGPPYYALAKARAADLHFFALTDHAWWLTSSEWTKTLSQTQAATVPGEFIALRGLEWTHDTVGHINIFNTETLVSRTNPLFADLSGLYTWLAANPHVIAQFNHPDARYGGTFADFAYHPAAAQVMYLQEIGNNAQKYTTYEASFVQSNAVGWKTAPTNNSDHHAAAWGSDNPARTGIIAPALTTENVLDALRQRRVFATEDSNLAVALRVGTDWMGSILPPSGVVPLTVEIVDQDVEAARLFLYDRNLLVATHRLQSNGQWSVPIEARPGHYFWVKVIQADGDTAYSAPIWIAGQAAPETVYINEILPAPGDVDWDGDGKGDYLDEWVEVFNPMDHAVGLGGWRLTDSSGAAFYMPLSFTIPARGYLTIYNSQMGFALNNSADTLTLIRPDGSVADTFSYSRSPGYDESWCRVEDGGDEWSDDCIASPDGANWRQGPAQPLKMHVFEAKKLAYDAWVRVTGRVTAPPGVLGPRAMYIQDDSAGILVYLPKEHGLTFNLGDKVAVEGNLRQFGGEFEIAVRHRSKVTWLEPGSPPPPLPLESTMMLEPFEGRLVMLHGQAVRFKGVTTFWVDDGTDPAKVYIRSTTGIKKPFIEPGTIVTVVGIVSQYSDPDNPTRYDYRLLPRFQADLGLPSPVEPAEPVVALSPDKLPSLLPETGSK
ncbi:MAG: lamin tail domain-containing protein [Anaerolineaceae bacterium]|nr:lamin tail domain-containing protein [Anaerolineaceae bacterium]